MEIAFNHNLTYTNKGKIPIGIIAKSLEANEFIIGYVGKVLEGCIEGIIVSKIEVGFKEATHNSPLNEKFFVDLILGFQGDLIKEVPQLITDITNNDAVNKYPSLITLIVIAIVVRVGKKMYSKLFPGKEPISLEKDYKKAVGGISLQLNISQNAVEKVIDKIADQKVLKKAVSQFFSPAKKEKGTKIIGDGNIEITAEAVSEFPDSELDAEGELEKSVPLQDVTIILRAGDIDRSKSRWAGIIEGIYDKRLKMEIYPTISREDIYGKTSLKGDILLVSKLEEDGSYKPYKFHLLTLDNSQ